jgi:hypothetical protein
MGQLNRRLEILDFQCLKSPSSEDPLGTGIIEMMEMGYALDGTW